MNQPDAIKLSARCKDITGEIFGRLTVIIPIGKDSTRSAHTIWLCRCSCGTDISVSNKSLRSKHTRSCGCLKTDLCIDRSTKHGMAHSKIYMVWSAMKGRCDNRADNAYFNYGGRGIRYCARWSEFKNFINDMGDRPSKTHTLDRIDNDGDYCKENCRWVTRKIQNRNKRNNVQLTYGGKSMCIADWAESTGIKYATIRGRLRYGWSIERTLTTPTRIR